MADFLPKQQFNVGSPLQYQTGGNDLAGDILSIMQKAAPMAQDRQEILLKERAEAGSMLARDSLIKFHQMRSGIIDSAIEDIDYDYLTAKNKIDYFVSEEIANAKEKFGSDSPAYKEFEASFLKRATELQLNFSNNLFEKHVSQSRERALESKILQVRAGSIAFDKKNLDDIATEFRNNGGDVTKLSGEVVSSMIGLFDSSAFNPASLFNSDRTLNVKATKDAFNSFFGGAVEINDDFSVESKVDFLSASDVAKIKDKFFGEISKLQGKQENNIDFTRTIADADALLPKLLPTGNLEEDGKSLLSLVDKARNELYSVPSPKDGDIKKYKLFKDKVMNKLEDFRIAYQVVQDPMKRNQFIDNGYVETERDGKKMNIKVDEKTYKAVVNSKYSNFLSTYSEAKQNGDTVLANDALRQVIQMEKETKTRSQELDRTFLQYGSGNIMPEQAVYAIDLMIGANNAGREAMAGEIYSQDNLRKAKDILMEDIPNAEKISKLNNHNANVKALQTVTQGEKYKTAKRTLEKIFASKSDFENFVQGRVMSIITNDDYVRLDESIDGGVWGYSTQIMNFLQDNGMLKEINPNDPDSMFDLIEQQMNGGNNEMSRLIGRKYFPPLKTVNPDGTVSTQIVDMDVLTNYAKDELGLSKLKRENLRTEYYYNASQNRMEINLRVKVDDTAGSQNYKVVSNQISGDMYNSIIDTAKRREKYKSKEKSFEDAQSDSMRKRDGLLGDVPVTEADIVF